jgi:hypothetical protein
MHAPLRSLFPTLLLATVAVAQSTVTGPYDAESFEAPRFAPGAVPGQTWTDGQDGWLLIDSLTYPAPVAAVHVQTQVVRSGAQAMRWNAAQMTPGCDGELRRNAMFSLSTGAIEAEFDFLLASGNQPSTAWGFYTQPTPHPQTAQIWWEIRQTGEIWYCSTSNRQWLGTGVVVARDTWHHTRTVVDVLANQTRLYLDGALVFQGQPTGVWANLPDHGFSQFWCNGAGDDALCVDNFTVRERVRPLGLSRDLPRLHGGVRSSVELRLGGHGGIGNHAYAVLGSLGGSTPGITLAPGVTLPLQPDWFLGVLAGGLGQTWLPGFLGTLNADGTATATFDTQAPVPAALVGANVTFAWFTYHPTIAASEPVQLPIAP